MERRITRKPLEPLKAQQFPGWTSGYRTRRSEIHVLLDVIHIYTKL